MLNKRVLLIALIAALFCLMLWPGSAKAASSSEIRNQIDEMEKEQQELLEQMEELEAALQENAQQIQEIVQQKGVIDQQITLLLGSIRNVNEQVAAYNVLIADTQEDLERRSSGLRI